MLIDQKQRPMIRAVSILAIGALILYFWDAPRHAQGPSGGSLVGLVFGVAALAVMLFCAAISLKRKVPHWRIGRAQSWMRGHVWLGLLTVLLVALHSAFHVGGSLTLWLWILLLTVTLSGLFGILLQQVIPRLLLHAVPGETLAQQLDRQLTNLRKLAEQAVSEAAGSLEAPAPGDTTRLVRDIVGAAPGSAITTETAEAATKAALETAAPEAMRRFHHDYLVPFFRGSPRTPLHSRRRSDSLYAALRTMTTPEQHPLIDELAELTERRRQLLRQRRLMRVLVAWLLVHVPLSWALLALTVLHAVVALRYGGA